MKFAACPTEAWRSREHIYSAIIEDVPHGSTELAEVCHTVFTIPKRLRVFFRYDRKLNTILFRAAWRATSHVLGMGDRELAAIFTVQTAGEALNYHPHLHGLLADVYWKDSVFSRFPEVDLRVIEDAFAEGVLAQLHKRELITDDDVASTSSAEQRRYSLRIALALASLSRRGLGTGGSLTL